MRRTDSFRGSLDGAAGACCCMVASPARHANAQRRRHASASATRNSKRSARSRKKPPRPQARLRDEIDAIGRRPPQAQPGTDRHRRAAARRRGPHRRRPKTGSSRWTTASARCASRWKDRRAVIAEVLAALQRIGRHPPPGADGPAGGRAAIGAHRHHARRRAAGDAGAGGGAGLATSPICCAFARRSPTEKRAADAGPRRADRGSPADRLLTQERQKKQTETEKALEAERQQAVMLARQVDNLKDLIGKAEQGLGSATRAARQADGRPRTKPRTIGSIWRH